MKTLLSVSQQHLLDALQIKPLALTEAFVRTDKSSEQTGFNAPDLTELFAQDIDFQLAGKRRWVIQVGLLQSELDSEQLITPPLSELLLPAQKKALWLLLGTINDMDEASG
ncbi:hypothetical protein [Rheinheimera baltica]|uniref:hypothetical protein n=1 Tax=Rheinheimera baltica TaxID=67576 RepID=UPI00273E7514|nr:hypothetical protein [Rheinheimera baltica]MDP5150019.1 hypothetical protein [Rheinheimera baltica]